MKTKITGKLDLNEETVKKFADIFMGQMKLMTQVINYFLSRPI